MFCVLTEVLWRKMIQLLFDKTTPRFQLLPMSKVDHLSNAASTLTQ